MIRRESFFRHYYKQALMLLVDTVLLVSALLFALWTRLGIVWIPPDPVDRVTLMIGPIASLFFFVRLGLYRSIIRYMGSQALISVTQGVTISALLVALVAFMTGGFMPRSVPLIYWGFAIILIGGTRMFIRLYYQKAVEIHKERVAIYGAGTSGLQVYKALLHGIEYKPVFFIDDNVAKQGMLIDGMHVYDSIDIEKLMIKYHATKILLAMPSVPLPRRKEIMHDLQQQGLAVQMVPGVEDLLNGTLNGNDDVSKVYENILGRDPVQPDYELMRQCIENKVVMVTGAGGSIGSELCRQILLIKPTKLLLIDSSEYALYNIEKDLLAEEDLEDLGHIEIISLIANVQDKEAMSRIIQAYGVQTVYHAAAYKHVPMVERNIIEGVRNNIFGTLHTAEAAVKHGVETFILISTDKAVRPTSILGATKRCAEIICQAFDAHFPTRFCIVRFGNVLGSSGSVIPLFFEQINSGGPLTVTHPDVTRYFMTLRESAQLVVQASSMGRGGDIFVLNMGQPVKIIDIARRMIQLMGYTVRDRDNPEGDIEIRITGMRPGEKLHEELLLGENVTGTSHPMILRAEEAGAELVNLKSTLGKLHEACNKADCVAIRHLLLEFIPEYKPSSALEDTVWRVTRTGIEGEETPVRRDNVEPLLRKPKSGDIPPL